MNAPTPNPVLVAAAPVLENVISELQTFFTAVLTGDPSQIALRFAAASQVLIGSIELQLPGLATAEIGVVQGAINGKLAGWKTSLAALASAPQG
jgi:hypothetical protein